MRFCGLFGGVELVSDRSARTPLPSDLMAALEARLRARGILLTISGMYGNVLRVQPPLSVQTVEVDTFLSALRATLAATRTHGTDSANDASEP